MLRGALHWLPAAPADIAVQVPLAGPMPPGKGPSDGTCVEDTCRKLQKEAAKEPKHGIVCIVHTRKHRLRFRLCLFVVVDGRSYQHLSPKLPDS